MKIFLLSILIWNLHSIARGSANDPNNSDNNYNFAGTLVFSGCSGSLVQFIGMSAQDRAYALTNAHCVSPRGLAPNEIISNQKSFRSLSVLSPNAVKIGYLETLELSLATNTGTDIALYRLKETYEDIYKEFGVEPFIIHNERPYVGESIEILSSYWQKGFSCYIYDFIPELREDGWRWQDSIRYSSEGCQTYGGTSGAPIVRSGTKLLLGINNTGSDSGEKCTLMNPCEVDKHGRISAHKGASYGQQTYKIYTCLNKDFEIDLKLAGCEF